jgi:hypothetical protein
MASTPMNPLAGPPGPGKYSTRPDLLRMGSTAYGEGVDTQSILQGAALSKTPDVRGVTNTAVRQAAGQKAEKMAGLYDPTERPQDQLHGISTQPQNNFTLPMQQESLSQILAKMVPYDTNGEIAALYEQAVARGL